MPVLSSINQKFLLQTARKSIAYYLKTGNYLALNMKSFRRSEGGEISKKETGFLVANAPRNDRSESNQQAAELFIKRACFVTLYQNKNLRGCIGTFDANKPLIQNVLKMSVSAAFYDSRFPKVQEKELPQIQISLSVLGELQKMNSLEELVLGQHGIFVKHETKSGTFLPEVATEQGWTKEKFINYCIVEKAGLSPELASDVEIYLYEVEKFSE